MQEILDLFEENLTTQEFKKLNEITPIQWGNYVCQEAPQESILDKGMC